MPLLKVVGLLPVVKDLSSEQKRAAYALMNRDDEYRARAEEAQREADRASNEEQREKWLRLVKCLLGLLRK